MRSIVLGLLVGIGLMALPSPRSGVIPRGYFAHLPMPTPAALNAPAIPSYPAAPADASGIGSYLGTFVEPRDYDIALEKLGTLGLSWTRTETPWAGVEPERGRFEWERWDASIDCLHARGYRILSILAYWAPWVEPYSDEALAGYERYAEVVARRYRGKVQAWEVWNEPNEGFWKSTPERYVDLLKAAWRGVKRGNPDALVVAGSTSGVDLHFIRRILRAGAGDYLDRISVHPYAFGWLPEDAEIVAELRGMAAELRSRGVSDRLWVTEFGPKGEGPGHAIMLERACILLWASGVVDRWMWFALTTQTVSGYELYRQDWSAKPSAEALSAVAARLRDRAPRGKSLPADASPPWASGRPTALSTLQAWSGVGRNGELSRVVWCPRGEVRDPATGVVYDFRPAWNLRKLR